MERSFFNAFIYPALIFIMALIRLWSPVWSREYEYGIYVLIVPHCCTSGTLKPAIMLHNTAIR